MNCRLRAFIALETPEFSKWLRKLRDRNAKARITSRLTRVQQGNLGDHKDLTGGLFEMRLRHGPGYRLYFAREGDVLIVLLICGDKSTQGKDIRHTRAILKGLE